MLNDSIICFSKGLGKALIRILNNKNKLIRIWFPYVIFIILNYLLYQIGAMGLIIAFIFDLLTGISIYRQESEREIIIRTMNEISEGKIKSKVDTGKLHFDNFTLANAVNSIGNGIEKAVETSIKDEKLKADLITNVSHDIKTPLTSIINYIGLIKREELSNEKIKKYVEILDNKSNKLRKLTEDLVEASKISSGNISVELSKINFVELINQSIGEFYEKFESKKLVPVFKHQEKNMMIMADPGHLWRVVDNLFGNICKYALPGTVVYMDMKLSNNDDCSKVVFTIKNISASEINVDSDELSERFIRGDESRTTEGSGLGLSIAKNLTKIQGGEFLIRLSCDIFEAKVIFDNV